MLVAHRLHDMLRTKLQNTVFGVCCLYYWMLDMYFIDCLYGVS